MAAYGALLSLSHLLHQILHPPPLNEIIIDRQQIEFLRAKIEAFIDFLETYPSRRSHEIADMEVRIRDAAYEAEDVIESNVMDQIHASDLYRKVGTSILSSHKQETSIISSDKKQKILTLLSLTKRISTLISPEKEKPILPSKKQEISITSSDKKQEVHTLLSQAKEISTLISPKEEKPIFRSHKEEEAILFSQKGKKPRLLSQKDISTLLCEGIETVLEKFLSIEKELVAMGVVGDLQLQSSARTTSSRSPLPGGKITMVGFEDHLFRIKDGLSSHESSRQIITIVGMAGIGKTTLATSVYNDIFIVEHFHVRAWVTVSQECNVEGLLLCLLSEVNKSFPDTQESSNDELGLQLHQKLIGRKYLIVMDDMWDIEVWNKVKWFLPRNDNGSRVLVTSRLSNLADDFGSCSPYKMDFLDKRHSWNLFCKTIFAEEDCPGELVAIGKYIVERCGGLPFSLVLISGLLSKSERTREHWEVFAEDMASSLNLGNDEQVMKILALSYTHLPVYLKPCFLYLAVFTEDYEIRVSSLVRLWVAEGLIKPSQDNGLEETAHDYIEDLVSRNLILVGERGSKGNMKYCKLHDLVRDLCIAQAEKEKFVHNAKLDNPNIPPNIEIARRLNVSATRKPLPKTIKALQLASLNRSWLSSDQLLEAEEDDDWFFETGTSILSKKRRETMTHSIINGYRLLRVVQENDRSRLIELLDLNNLRYAYTDSVSSVLSMPLCWNLQTLLLSGPLDHDLPHEIWLMPQLRHLKLFAFALPDPPTDEHNVIVLENLRTIKGVKKFKCSEHVLKRIPNLTKLRLVYVSGNLNHLPYFCLHNLTCFKKLESLNILGFEELWRTIAFPNSLKKLTLSQFLIPWEDISIVVGSLPNLEVLKLDYGATKGEEWIPIEEKFCQLKFLFIWSPELKIWDAESCHFPCLEHLFLYEMDLEIPVGFSDIVTLERIDLSMVNDSMWTSAKRISSEREELGYEPLLLRRHAY